MSKIDCAMRPREGQQQEAETAIPVFSKLSAPKRKTIK